MTIVASLFIGPVKDQWPRQCRFAVFDQKSETINALVTYTSSGTFVYRQGLSQAEKITALEFALSVMINQKDQRFPAGEVAAKVVRRGKR